MMNNSKKKNFKRTIIFIIVGVVILNLLLSFITRANAVDYTDVYIKYGTGMEKFVYSVTTAYTSIDEVTLNPSHGSVNYDIEYYIITNYPYETINLNAYTVSGTQSFTLTKITDYNNYNIFKATGGYRYFNGYEIVFGTNNIGDDIYLFECLVTGGANYHYYVEQLHNEVKRLNVPKYVVQTIDIGYDEFDSVNYNMAITYPYEIYLNQQSRVLYIEGQVALTGGINQYIYTVNGGLPNDITNNYESYSVTDDFINEVNFANFGITDYNINAYFNLGIVLLSYENETVSITVSALSNYGDVIDIITIPEVHVYNEFDESETETETETDSPIEPDDGSYKEGYDKGYQEAFRNMLNGNLVGGKIEYNLHKLDTGVIKSYSHEIITAPYANPNYLPTNGLSLKQVYDDWVNFGGTLNDHLVSLNIFFKNPVFIQFNRLRIKLPDSCVTDGKPNVIIYAIIEDETSSVGYTLKATSFRETYGNNEFGISFNIADEYVAGIQIANIFPIGAKDTYIKFETGVLALHEYSYNQGIIEGQTRVNSNAYTEGKKEGWQIGFYKGYEVAQEDKNFLVSCITSVFDAFLLLIMSLFNFEIMGVNLLGFFAGIITLIIIFFIVKRVFF